MNQSDEKKYWLDDKRNVQKVVWGVVIVCAGLVLGDLLYEKHGHFAVEHWFGFYGFYGFVACVFLVLSAKVLRKLVMRDENYYGDAEPTETETEESDD